VAEVEPVWPQDEVAVHGVVDDKPCNESRDVPRHPDAEASLDLRLVRVHKDPNRL
jgi:hypothetical protein